MTSSLRKLDRLREIVVASRGGRSLGPETPAAGAGAGSSRLALHEVARVLGATVATDGDERCLVVHRTYPAGDRYGARRLGEYPCPSDVGLGLLASKPSRRGADDDESPDDVTCTKGDEVTGTPSVVYFDLETSGLSGGAGIVPFIIGLGWFMAEGFETRQYFLASPTAEPRALDAVATVLRRARTLVTFNGRSFDGPMTETRYAFHRRASPLQHLSHVDLLHPSRHLWRGDEGRLVSLERDVLGVHRVGDVPGAEIPGRYHAFLRGGDAELLAPVLEHNRLDLVSLGLLTGLACALLQDGASSTVGASQAFGLGRIFEKLDRVDDAVACYCHATRHDPQASGRTGRMSPRRPSQAVARAEREARAESLARLGSIYRRQRRYEEAARVWTRLLSASGVPGRLRREATVALAIHHEHREQDLVAAQIYARAALAAGDSPTHRHAVEHRLTRLGKKLVGGRATAGDARTGFDW